MTYIVAIGAYLVLLTIFGLIVARKKVKTSDDMVTGGHRIPFIILVGSPSAAEAAHRLITTKE